MSILKAFFRARLAVSEGFARGLLYVDEKGAVLNSQLQSQIAIIPAVS